MTHLRKMYGRSGVAQRRARAAMHIGRAGRHPGVADMIVDVLESDPATPIFSAVVEAFMVPALRHEGRTGCSRRGWQHEGRM